MNQILEMVKRNIKLFIRDRSAVFFSFMSTIILVALYFLFIAGIYAQGFEDSNSGISTDAANFIIYSQMMAGVLILNSLSLSLGVFTTAAKDFEARRVDSFLLTPLSGTKLLSSYLISAFAASITLNAITWLAAALLVGLLTGYYLTVSTLLMGVVVLLAASIISGAIMMLITAAIRSVTALGVINGVAGTFFGFLCGIYMPYSNLGEGAAMVGSFIPYTHLTIWLKQIVLGDAFDQAGIPVEYRDGILENMFSANNLGVAGLDASLPVMLALCAVFGLICLVSAWVILKGRMKRA